MGKTKLFLLHFAGGNCYSYQFLQPMLSEHYTVHALELPGRGKRMGEPLLDEMDDALTDMMKQILSHLMPQDKFIIFGHSLGATLSWLVTLELEKKGYYPMQLVVSGNPGPNIGENFGLSTMPQRSLINALRKMGGLPEELIANKELFEFFEPSLRADFALSESRFQLPAKKVKTPLYAIMGDVEQDVEHIQNWGKYCNEFSYELMEGGHFYIHQNKDKLIKLLASFKAKAVH